MPSRANTGTRVHALANLLLGFSISLQPMNLLFCFIGLAIMGMRSVVELEFMDFSMLALDQIVNQAAKMHYFYGGQITVPMVVRMPIVSRVGLGPQHSQSLEAWFMHIPGLRVVIPSNAYDAKGLLTTALEEPNPVVFIENVKLYNTKADVPEERYSIPFGKARILAEGRDVTLVAISGTVPEALGDLIDCQAVIALFLIPVRSEACLCNRIPFVRTVDMLKTDKVSCLIRIGDRIYGDFLQGFEILFADFGH